MSGAYYNEFDPFAAAWLRELIKEGLIADGEVDERSIVDVGPADLAGFTQCHFFAGIGGWSYALRLAGWPDDRPVWTGSCPCQPFSLAGAQKGFSDPRHLWPEFKRLIAERRPPIIFGEQVASASEWLRLVRSDLETLGYAVAATAIQAASAGADHLRDRYWFVGHTTEQRSNGGQNTSEPHGRSSIEATSTGAAQGDACGAGLAQRPLTEDQRGNVRCEGPSLTAASAGSDDMAHPNVVGTGEGREQRSRQQRWISGDSEPCDWVIGADGKARRVKPGVRLLAHGVPSRVGLLRGFGNAIDPRPAAAFIQAAAEAMT